MELLYAQIDPHQVAYKAVASWLHVQFACAEYISFLTIVTNNIEPLSAARARIDDATHIKAAKYESSSALKLAFIRSPTRLWHRSYMC